MNPKDLFTDVRRVEMTNEEYHSSPWRSISKSRLTKFAEDPQLFYQQFISREYKQPKSDALVFGTAYHEVVLERQGEVSEGSFDTCTLAIFRPIAVPKREPDLIGDDERMWITELPEPGVIRQSSMWGELLGDRHWEVLPNPGNEVVTAFCAFDDMIVDGSVVTSVPARLLSKDGKKTTKVFKEFREEHAGEILYSPPEWMKILAMRRMLRCHTDIHQCLFQDGGMPEQTFVGKCAITGLEVRWRIDFLRLIDNAVLSSDLKSAWRTAPHKFAKDAARLLYHVQAAMIIGCLEHVYPDRHVIFKFVAQEKDGIYRAKALQLEPEFVEEGCKEYARQMQRLRRCVDSNVWWDEKHGETEIVHTPECLMNQTHFVG